MILVDSSVWIEYFHSISTPAADTLDALSGVELLVVGDLTLAEVLQGFTDGRDFEMTPWAYKIFSRLSLPPHHFYH